MKEQGHDDGCGTAESLVHRSELEVKFSEVDPLGIVWHGHYVRYFEDGREAFGKANQISYLDFFDQGIVVPVVSIHCDYKRSLKYGDRVIIETIYKPCQAAKLRFEYRLFNAESNELVASGSSVQVFLDKTTSSLILTNPPFFEKWKSNNGFT